MWRIVAGHPKTFYTREEVVRFATAWADRLALLDFGALSSFSLYYTCAQHYHGMADSVHRSASLVSALSAGHLATIVPLTGHSGQGQFRSGPGRWGDW